MTEPMSEQRREEIRRRAANASTYADYHQIAGRDVPDLLAEIDLLRTENDKLFIDYATERTSRETFQAAFDEVRADRDKLAKRVKELEAEFTGRVEWTIGTTEQNGETYYTGTYTENGAKYHAARRQGDTFPAWRRDTIWHREDNSAEEAEYAAMRAAAETKEA